DQLRRIRNVVERVARAQHVHTVCASSDLLHLLHRGWSVQLAGAVVVVACPVGHKRRMILLSVTSARFGGRGWCRSASQGHHAAPSLNPDTNAPRLVFIWKTSRTAMCSSVASHSQSAGARWPRGTACYCYLNEREAGVKIVGASPREESIRPHEGDGGRSVG